MTQMLSVDPGFQGTGWALWNGRILADAGVIHAIHVEDLGTRASGLHRRIQHLFKMKAPHVEVVVIEWPQFFESAKGTTAAARGDLGMVYLAASIVACVAWERRRSVRLLHVNDWKGTMSKEVVKTRIQNVLSTDRCRGFHTHMWDAVGIGLSHLKLFGS